MANLGLDDPRADCARGESGCGPRHLRVTQCRSRESAIMTHTRQYHDDEGEFAEAKLTESPCRVKDCPAPVRVRTWESSDGAYEDYQFRCERGHVWWIDGIDS
jgi:hypothetical protein